MTQLFKNLEITNTEEIYLDGNPVDVKSCAIDSTGENVEFALEDGRIVRIRRDVELGNVHYQIRERFYFANQLNDSFDAAEELAKFNEFFDEATVVFQPESLPCVVIDGENVEEDTVASFDIENFLDVDDFAIFDANPYQDGNYRTAQSYREELQELIDQADE